MNFDSSSIAGLAPAYQAFHGASEVVTEQIDMSQVSVGALVPAESTVVTQDVSGQNPSLSLPTKTATVKLSKMPVAVDKRVFLDPEKAELYNGDPDLIIYGIVSVCPRKSNGDRYSIDWSAFQLPAELNRTLLRATMPKEEVKGLLVEGKDLFIALAARFSSKISFVNKRTAGPIRSSIIGKDRRSIEVSRGKDKRPFKRAASTTPSPTDMMPNT